MRRFFLNRRARGFTLIELMLSLTILTLLAIFGGRIYLNYTDASRDLKAGNLVYEEARFLMERLVREVRQNGIDYEQYYNQNINIQIDPAGGYADNYCTYSSFFYDNDNESIGSRNLDLEDDIINIYGLEPEAVRPIEAELYLINMAGDKRTVLTRVVKDVEGETIGKVAMLKMVGRDFGDDHINGRESYNLDAGHDFECIPDDREGDGKIDSWHCDAGYPCDTKFTTTSTSYFDCEGYTHKIVNDPLDADHSFVDLSPNALNIINLQFIVSPQDDPWKAYNMNEVQIQPHVTIQMTAEANPKLVGAVTEKLIPSITLTSTVTTRNYNEINSDCR
jgi:prepilin-type N-terminal cleavage/methylation domain-containing protein